MWTSRERDRAPLENSYMARIVKIEEDWNSLDQKEKSKLLRMVGLRPSGSEDADCDLFFEKIEKIWEREIAEFNRQQEGAVLPDMQKGLRSSLQDFPHDLANRR